MTWQVSLFFWYIFSVWQALYQRSYSRNSHLPPSFPPALSYLLVLSPVGIVVGLIIPHSIQWNSWVIFLLALEGVLIGLYNWLMFRALKTLPVAKFQIIFQLYAFVVVILGWVLLQEKLNLYQIIGGTLILTAAYLAIRAPLDSQKQLHQNTNRNAIITTFITALALGAGLVTEKVALKYMDLGAYFIFGFATQTIALTLLALTQVSKQTMKIITRSDIKKSLVMGTNSALAGFTYIFALQHSGNISLLTVLCAFSLPLTVLAAYYILGERENKKIMFIATIVGLLGLIIAAF